MFEWRLLGPAPLAACLRHAAEERGNERRLRVRLGEECRHLVPWQVVGEGQLVGVRTAREQRVRLGAAADGRMLVQEPAQQRRAAARAAADDDDRVLAAAVGVAPSPRGESLPCGC